MEPDAGASPWEDTLGTTTGRGLGDVEAFGSAIVPPSLSASPTAGDSLAGAAATIAATAEPTGGIAGSGRSETAQHETTPYYLVFFIISFERSSRKDPIFKFDVKTNLPPFRTNHIRDVRRTHLELVKFAEHLISENPECIVPPVPASVTSAGAGTAEDDRRMVERLQRWFDRVSRNPILIRDEEVVLFVESDFGYSPIHNSGNPQTGLKRKALKQLSVPPDDSQELSDARPIIKAFYKISDECAAKLDRLSRSRRNASLAEVELGSKLCAFATLETHQGMANAFRKMGKTIQTVADLFSAHATIEAVSFMDPLLYASASAYVVKETLTTRHMIMREHLSAQAALRSKLATANRLKSALSIQSGKVDDALYQLEEAKETERKLQAKLTRVTNNLVAEKRQWIADTVYDIRNAIRDYVLRSIESERKILAILEVIRVDVRNIDPTGGLSRLGRENTFVQRSRAGVSNLAPSQGRESDAWSGLPRRASNLEGAVAPPEHLHQHGLHFPDIATGARDPQGGENTEAQVILVSDAHAVDARSAASLLAGI